MTSSTTLKVGDKAPEFSLPASTGGEPISLKDQAGKKVVLYFYPKDDTPGCTKEACGFRDANADLTKAGAVVLGINVDKMRSHSKFARKLNLNFPLLSDEDKKVSTAYGAWGEKSMYGRAYMGIYRMTFLIDEQGKIQEIWPNVKPEGHAQEILTLLRAG